MEHPMSKIKPNLKLNSQGRGKGKSSNLGLSVFGLCFFIPALIILVLGPLDTFRLHFLTSFWEQVPAELISIDVDSHQGDDSTTYSLEGSYSYQYFGTTYQSSQISFFSGADNVGDWHSEAASNIRRAAGRGQLVAWVNSDNPNESYLVRDIRPFHMFFTFIFAFGGVSSCGHCASVAIGQLPHAYPLAVPSLFAQAKLIVL
jgi:hypothetical protein